MDLVSNTLDKYLRHRFNGINPDSRPDDDNPNASLIHELKMHQDSCNSIGILNLSFHKMMPCCVTIRDDLLYVAAGFENSQIYLWTLSSQSPEDQQCVNLVGETSPGETLNKSDRHKTPKLETMSKLTAHSGVVYSIQFLADNNDLMLSCSEDTTIRLWCLKSKCNLFVYRGHNYPIWSITIALQGDYFASASMDTTARLWRFDRMCPIRIFCGHEDDVECVKFHPNAKYIATGSSDSTVRLWTISDGRMVRLMVGHKSPITNLSFLPDGKFLASASSDGAVKIWNLATNSILNDLLVPEACHISFSPQQEFISTCGRDNILRLWQVEKSTIVERKQINFCDRFSKMIEPQFLRDQKLLVTGLSKRSAE